MQDTYWVHRPRDGLSSGTAGTPIHGFADQLTASQYPELTSRRSLSSTMSVLRCKEPLLCSSNMSNRVRLSSPRMIGSLTLSTMHKFCNLPRSRTMRFSSRKGLRSLSRGFSSISSPKQRAWDSLMRNCFAAVNSSVTKWNEAVGVECVLFA